MAENEPETASIDESGTEFQPKDKSQIVRIAFDQAWGFSIAYLCLGLLAEILRKFDLSIGDRLQEFLDGLPFLILRLSGLMNFYIDTIASGLLNPFWNRIILSASTVLLIFIFATFISFLMLLMWLFIKKRRNEV